MRRSLKLIAGLTVAGLAMAACSSNSTTASSSTSAATSAASSAAASSAAGSSAAGSGAASSGAAATSGLAEITGDAASVKVGLAYDIGGRGDQSFNDLAAKALDHAKEQGVTVVGELEAGAGEPDSAKVDRLNQLVDSGATLILGIGFAYSGPITQVAGENPDIKFGIVDSVVDAPNVTSLIFAANEGSFLVGAAAALQTEADNVGFIGGVNVPLIQSFQAGFDAGAKAVNPDIKITDSYLAEPGDTTKNGFNDPQLGETTAKGIYDNGTDIIFAAAGGSGAGVFKAAKAAGTYGIGVDSDQYNVPSLADVKDVIITSMVKNVDVAVADLIASNANGDPLTGTQLYNLKNNGVGYSTSGGAIDAIVPQLDEYKQQIIDGTITVPDTVS
ncbi:MAG: BMP family ABC transporter substrate-binding protein [Nakamurella sp.]